MRLVRFTPDDGAAVAAYVALRGAVREADEPWEAPLNEARQRQDMIHGWDGELGAFFLAEVDGEPVGTVTTFEPEQENRELTWVDLRIAPAYRRRGYGRAALTEIERAARVAGRPLVLLEGGLDTPAARGFAAAAAYPLAQVMVRRAQELTGSTEEQARFAALLHEAEAQSAAYDLVRVRGRTPEDLLDGLVAAVAAINDAPLDDLEYEDENYDVDRIRAFEQAQEASGMRLRRVIARERATGEIAGHTVVTVFGEAPAYAEQDDTTVVESHRGHRLGLRLKAEMLCWLATEEPQLRQILTSNAETNAAMIAVNEQLGQRVVARQLLFQRRV